MTQLQFKGGRRAIAIVAHPDDETIWMGGFILKHPELKWTIFSLCRASDPDRAPKFKRVCDHYGAKMIMADLEDDDKLSLKKSLPVIEKIISENISGKKYDYLFTHGGNGEYGHPRHLGVNKVVGKMLKEKKINAKKVFYFDYAKQSRKEFAPPVAKKNSDYYLKLTAKEYAAKKAIMTNVYGFDPNGIDAGYCTNPEAFKINKIQ